uniref:Uncharacterized protein n=1 Tax=Laticauda laticaudata TaxID=8630 RepID=A0A8C5RG82_LATLA
MANRAIQDEQVIALTKWDPLEKEMATYFSIFAMKIPWTMSPSGQKVSNIFHHSFLIG